MKQRQTLVIAAVAILVLGLALSAVQAQEKSQRIKNFKISCRGDWAGFDKNDLKVLRKFEALKDLKIRIRGLKDLENFRVNIDLDGLHESLKELDHLGERIERMVSRHLERFDSREFRKVVKALEKLKVDIDID